MTAGKCSANQLRSELMAGTSSEATLLSRCESYGKLPGKELFQARVHKGYRHRAAAGMLNKLIFFIDALVASTVMHVNLGQQTHPLASTMT